MRIIVAIAALIPACADVDVPGAEETPKEAIAAVTTSAYPTEYHQGICSSGACNNNFSLRTNLTRPGITQFAYHYINTSIDHHIGNIAAGHQFDATGRFNPAYAAVGFRDDSGKEDFTYTLTDRQLPISSVFCGYDAHFNGNVGSSICTHPGDQYEHVIVGFDLSYGSDHHIRYVYGWPVVDGTMRFQMGDDSRNWGLPTYTAWALIPKASVQQVTGCSGRSRGVASCAISTTYPVLSEFSMKFTNGDHHLSQIAIDIEPTSIRLAFNDKNSDDEYTWDVRVVDLK
jgi:hypothetical protein